MTEKEFIDKLLAIRLDLQRFASSLTGDSYLANDLVQDTFYKALRHREHYVLDESFTAWVFTIMKNTFINEYRKQQIGKSIIDTKEDLSYVDPRDESISPESIIAVKELHELIDSLTNQDHKEAFELYLYGLQYDEIAKAVGTSIGTIKSRIWYARRTLINLIKKDIRY